MAISEVEEYLPRAVMTGWMAERLSGGESLILKECRVLDGEVGGSCAMGIQA